MVHFFKALLDPVFSVCGFESSADPLGGASTLDAYVFFPKKCGFFRKKCQLSEIVSRFIHFYF